jgi:hypothetical protein
MKACWNPGMKTAARTIRLVAAAIVCLAEQLLAQDDAIRHDVPVEQRTVLNVRVGSDSAASMLAKLGLATQRMSLEGYSVYINWCYLVGDDSSGVTVNFRSYVGDTVSKSHELTEFRLVGAFAQTRGAPCTRLNSALPLATAGGLRIGLSRSEVKGILGSVVHSTTDSLVYVYEAAVPLDKNGPDFAIWSAPDKRKACDATIGPFFLVYGEIDVVFADDRAVDIRIVRNHSAIC